MSWDSIVAGVVFCVLLWAIEVKARKWRLQKLKERLAFKLLTEIHNQDFHPVRSAVSRAEEFVTLLEKGTK